MAFVISVRDVEGKSDSATGVTLTGASYCAKAFRGTRRSGADAVPELSSGLRSLYPVRGIVCLPEQTKCSERSWWSWVVIIFTT